jgi:SAM-dependent methyltransferase
VACEALAVGTRLHVRAGFLAGLGLTPAEVKIGDEVIGDAIQADPTGKTAVPGVWVAGNATMPMGQIIGAAAAGVMAGAQINADLVAEETAAAVARRKHMHSHADDPGYGQEWWDGFYAEQGQLWSGKANVALVKEAADLTPGTALDLGAGEGGDAVWLAQQGWQVTAVDISGVAMDRGAAAATEAGVADRIDWVVMDLYEDFPAGQYDLVATSYLHTHDPRPRDTVLKSAAAAVTAGGTLLIIGHSEHGPSGNAHHLDLPGPAEVVASLGLPEDEWEVLVTEEFSRTRAMPDGEEFTHVDNAVKVRRRP